jgi:hypothetical protein
MMPSSLVSGAATVAGQALFWAQVNQTFRRALVNGVAGVVGFRDDRPFAVGTFTLRGGKIAEINILADPERLAQLNLTVARSQPPTGEGPDADS